jgi:hypothetical protein
LVFVVDLRWSCRPSDVVPAHTRATRGGWHWADTPARIWWRRTNTWPRWVSSTASERKWPVHVRARFLRPVSTHLILRSHRCWNVDMILLMRHDLWCAHDENSMNTYYNQMTNSRSLWLSTAGYKHCFSIRTWLHRWLTCMSTLDIHFHLQFIICACNTFNLSATFSVELVLLKLFSTHEFSSFRCKILCVEVHADHVDIRTRAWSCSLTMPLWVSRWRAGQKGEVVGDEKLEN